MDEFGGGMTEFECVEKLGQPFLDFDFIQEVGILLQLVDELLQGRLNRLCREGEGVAS